jgi:hypothetical protein
VSDLRKTASPSPKRKIPVIFSLFIFSSAVAIDGTFCPVLFPFFPRPYALLGTEEMVGSFRVFNPGGISRIRGTALVRMATVAISPCVPP